MQTLLNLKKTIKTPIKTVLSTNERNRWKSSQKTVIGNGDYSSSVRCHGATRHAGCHHDTASSKKSSVSNDILNYQRPSNTD